MGTDSVYDRLISLSCSWTQGELRKAFRSIAFNTSFEQLDSLFEKELSSDREVVETGKVIQEAKDRVTNILQTELCLKHLVCPECAGDLSKAVCKTEDTAYWDAYQCKSCSFTAKRSH